MHNYYKKNNVIPSNNWNSASKSLTSCHLYHYAGNNPIKFLDFNGFTDELYFTEEDSIKAVQNYISQNYKGNEFSGVITKDTVSNSFVFYIQEGTQYSVLDGRHVAPDDFFIIKFHSHPSYKDELFSLVKKDFPYFETESLDFEYSCIKTNEGFEYQVKFKIICYEGEEKIEKKVSRKMVTTPSNIDYSNKIYGVREILFVPDCDKYFEY